MPTAIQSRRKANKYTDRRCESCRKPTDGLSSLCRVHLRRRGKLGSVKATRQLRHADYAYLVGVATKFLKKNPPPADVLTTMQRFLEPPGMPSHYNRHGGSPRALLISEMQRWSDPRYRKKVTDHGGWSRKADYSPKGILAVLIAVEAYVEEREGNGFPHDAEHTAMMFALVRLWKRPRSYAPRWQNRNTKRVSPSVLRELIKRWREFTTLGMFVLKTARAVLREQAEAQKLKRSAPAAPQAPPLTHFTLAPRYPRPRLLSIQDAEKVRAWERHESLWRQHPTGQVPRIPTPHPQRKEAP